MGQYFLIVNLDEGEYLDPRDFNEGLHLGEFTDTIEVLSYLLCDSETCVEHPLVGHWAGDKVQIAGDSSEIEFQQGDTVFENLFSLASERFERISNKDEVKELFRLIQSFKQTES